MNYAQDINAKLVLYKPEPEQDHSEKKFITFVEFKRFAIFDYFALANCVYRVTFFCKSNNRNLQYKVMRKYYNKIESYNSNKYYIFRLRGQGCYSNSSGVLSSHAVVINKM